MPIQLCTWPGSCIIKSILVLVCSSHVLRLTVIFTQVQNQTRDSKLRRM